MAHGARPLRSTRRLQNYASTLPKWYTVVKNLSGPSLINIYDEIGFYGVPAAAFLNDLHQLPGDIEVHLNSPGGDIYEGLAIYNGLLQAQKRGIVQVIIDGLAASAASFIAMGASPGKLEVAPHSRVMIHDGFCLAIGNAADMRELADQLDAESDNIAGIYADRTGKPAAYWRGKMRAETWYTDQQAVDEGLADRIHGQDDSPRNTWDMSVFDHAPEVVTIRNADGDAPVEGGGNGQDAPECKTCGGSGRLKHPATGENGATCPACDGTGTYDPDNDGDDDSTAKGDTDHDYVSASGYAVGNRAPARWLNADKYKQADRDEMAKSGEAMPDGSYPIRDAEDVGNAVRAVGRGGADHDAIRRHVIKRADAIGESSQVPDDWNADGSLKDLSHTEILAIFARELDQLDAGRE